MVLHMQLEPEEATVWKPLQCHGLDLSNTVVIDIVPGNFAFHERGNHLQLPEWHESAGDPWQVALYITLAGTDLRQELLHVCWRLL
jgi:hypothetical protein